jgi:hypothetical protein
MGVETPIRPGDEVVARRVGPLQAVFYFLLVSAPWSRTPLR